MDFSVILINWFSDIGQRNFRQFSVENKVGMLFILFTTYDAHQKAWSCLFCDLQNLRDGKIELVCK